MSDTRPDVSIIIPAYNAEDYLSEAIESALMQRDVKSEIIVVNDGSTDKTEEIAYSYNVKVVSQKNKGLPGARNSGIDVANGKWIAFLDADDVWEPNKLLLQLRVADSDPEVVLVFCDAWLFRDKGVIVSSAFSRNERYFLLKKHAVAKDSYVFDEDMAVKIMKQNYIVTPSTVIVRADRLRDVGCFDEALKLCEDYELWIRLLKEKKAGVVERPLVGYRQHESNLSNDRHAMAYGRIEVADRVAADPTPYPEGAEAFFREERWRRQVQLGRMALHEGDLAQARRFLAESLKYRKSKENLALYLSTFGGPLGLRAALGLKRALGLKLD